MELHIDEEFKSLLPDLSDSERKELEKQILRDGVLNPIIAWNGSIVDGHNRYMICKLNGINEFPVKEMKFESREDVIEWILRHQLGRRNLTDFQRTKIALRYEEMIANRAKERQGTRNDLLTSGSMEHKVIDTHRTRDEIAKIAGTSGSTVMRTKYILENGTEEQIARAEKGGKETDGRSNSIRAISDEIRKEKEDANNVSVNVRICNSCGRTLPENDFYFERPGRRRTVCKQCYNTVSKSVKKDKKSNVKLYATAEEIEARLYDDGKEVAFTEEDLLKEIRVNGEEAINTLHTTCIMHRELLENDGCVEKVNELISELIESMKKITEVKENEEIQD